MLRCFYRIIYEFQNKNKSYNKNWKKTALNGTTSLAYEQNNNCYIYIKYVNN